MQPEAGGNEAPMGGMVRGGECPGKVTGREIDQFSSPARLLKAWRLALNLHQGLHRVEQRLRSLKIKSIHVHGNPSCHFCKGAQ